MRWIEEQGDLTAASAEWLMAAAQRTDYADRLVPQVHGRRGDVVPVWWWPGRIQNPQRLKERTPTGVCFCLA